MALPRKVPTTVEEATRKARRAVATWTRRTKLTTVQREQHELKITVDAGQIVLFFLEKNTQNDFATMIL